MWDNIACLEFLDSRRFQTGIYEVWIHTHTRCMYKLLCGTIQRAQNFWTPVGFKQVFTKCGYLSTQGVCINFYVEPYSMSRIFRFAHVCTPFYVRLNIHIQWKCKHTYPHTNMYRAAREVFGAKIYICTPFYVRLNTFIVEMSAYISTMKSNYVCMHMYAYKCRHTYPHTNMFRTAREVVGAKMILGEHQK